MIATGSKLPHGELKVSRAWEKLTLHHTDLLSMFLLLPTEPIRYISGVRAGIFTLGNRF